MPAILDAGFNLDFVDDGVLAERGARRPGRSSPSARTGIAPIVLPDVERMPPATLRALEALRAAGRAACSPRGARRRWRPGYLATAGRPCRRRGGRRPPVPRRRRRRRVRRARRRTSAPRSTSRLQPDVAVSAGAADIGFVHRRTDDGRHLLRREHVEHAAVVRRDVPRGRRRGAERWNPLTGRPRRSRSAAPRRDAGATVALDLAPYESTVDRVPRGRAAGARPPRGAARPAVAAAAARHQHRLARDVRPDGRAGGLGHAAIVDRRRGARGTSRASPSYEKTVDVPAGDAAARPGRAARLRRADGHRGRRPAGARAGLGRRAGARGGRRVRERPARRVGLVPAVRAST